MATTRIKKRKSTYMDGGNLSKIPKAEWGALIAPALSLVTGLFNQGKQRREQEEAENRAKTLSQATLAAQDRVVQQNFDPEGFGTVNYYQAKGGKLAKSSTPIYSATGGDLIPISDDSVVAKGNKHGETTIDNTSGIKLSKDGKTPFVEIEDDEVIKDGNKVYSDRLKSFDGKTFADKAERLARIKKRTENKIASGNLISRNTSKRTLANIDKEENDLFMEQETMKEREDLDNPNTPVAAYGDFLDEPRGHLQDTRFNQIGVPESSFNSKIGKGVEAVAPFLDNIVNMFLTNQTPKIPEPRIQSVPSFQTKVNVQPQMDDITRGVESSADFIKRNSSDSNAARNAVTRVRLRGIEEKGKVNAYKQNTEAHLYNQNVRNVQAVTSQNLAKVDNFNMANFYRSNDIQERISQNVANFADDIVDRRNYKASERFNKERLDVAKQMYNQGTTRRALLGNESELQYLRDNPKYAAEIFKKFQGTDEEQEFRKLVGF